MSLFYSLGEFLTSVPPGEERLVKDAVAKEQQHLGSMIVKFKANDIRLECTSEACGGVRTFESHGDKVFKKTPNPVYSTILQYTCRNCEKSEKAFAIRVTVTSDDYQYANVLKLGEEPAFGPPVPARVVTLIGEDRDAFLKGRRCENQGLGVGAFAYYRRVVENQRTRLFDEIIRAARRLNVAEDQIKTLEAAQRETQFSKSIDMVKKAIPPDLLIKGHNPLTLLHSAVSEGIHAMTDEACLAAATDVREVLFALAERVAQVMKDQAGLDTAIGRLTQKGNAQK